MTADRLIRLLRLRQLPHARAGAFACAAAVATLGGVAHGAPAAKHSTARVFGSVAPQVVGTAASRAVGRSIGSPTEGHLVGGAHLDDAPYLRVVPSYAGGDVRWGLESLVGLLDRAAKSVRKQYPDAVMSVGHLSRAGGGELDRHASHESGRDADVAFYVKNQLGKPIYAEHFVAFKGDGTAASWPGAHFDDARNWALVAALVGDGRAHVSHLFVATPIRARLLEYAQRIGAPWSLRVRASEVMAQPRGSLPHDDHFHVRISCPSGMEGCIELPTLHADRFAHAVRGARGRPRAIAMGTGSAGTPVAGASRAGSLGAQGGASGIAASGVLAPSPPQHASLPPKAASPKIDNADLPAIPLAPREAEPSPPAPTLDPGEAPPASMSAPIDDVDGPAPFGQP